MYRLYSLIEVYTLRYQYSSYQELTVCKFANTCEIALSYFSGYKTEIFSFQNKPKDLDPSCKMDLDLWDCFGRVKLVL